MPHIKTTNHKDWWKKCRKGLCPYQIYFNIKRRYTQSIFSGKQKKQRKGNTMDEKKIEKLYELMERAKKEHDVEAVAALRWAIFKLENYPEI